jgi:drug/metabolite transporter (DMT)-like permease
VLTVVLGLGSAFGYAVHDFLMVKVVRGASLWAALTFVMVVGLAILLPLALIVDGLPHGDAQWRAVGYAAGSGILEALGLGALLKGLVRGRLSVVAPIASLSGGFAALIAIVMGETLPGLVLLGLPLAVVGGALASMERTPGEARSARPTAGAGWAFLCALLFSGTLVLFGAAKALPPLSLAAYGRLTTLVVLVPLALLTGGLRLPREFRPRVTVAGVVDAGAFFCLAAATGIGPVAVASVAVAQSGTMAALLGLVVLREKLSRVQIVGVVLTGVAITMLATAGLD